MEPTEIYAVLDEAYFSDHPHEEAVILHLGRLLSGASVFADVGASLGQYTRAASRLLRGATLVAVEADPIRFDRLRSNCATWGQETGNDIRAVHAAATDEQGQVTFYTTGSNVSGSLDEVAIPAGARREPITVQAVTLDSLFPDRAPDVVKIDVEGAELAVLRGASRLLAGGIRHVLVEVHGENGPALVDLMKRHGFRRTVFYGQTLFTKSLVLWITLTVPRLPRFAVHRLRRH